MDLATTCPKLDCPGVREATSMNGSTETVEQGGVPVQHTDSHARHYPVPKSGPPLSSTTPRVKPVFCRRGLIEGIRGPGFLCHLSTNPAPSAAQPQLLPSKGLVLVLRAACFWLAAHLHTCPHQDKGVKPERRGRKQHKRRGGGGSRTQGPGDAEHAVCMRASHQRTAVAKAQGRARGWRDSKNTNLQKHRKSTRGRGGREKTREETRRSKNSAATAV